MNSMNKVIKKKNHISTLQKVTNFIFQKETFYISLEILKKKKKKKTLTYH